MSEAKKEEVPKVPVEEVKVPTEEAKIRFGDMPLNQSQGNFEELKAIKYTAIQEIDDKTIDTIIRIRARLHASRIKGKACFIVLRDYCHTIQACMFAGGNISKEMIAYAKSLPKESIVEMVAKVTKPSKPVESCSVKLELQIEELWGVNKSVPVVPFQMEDATRKAENQEVEENAAEEMKDGKKIVRVKQETRLDHRFFDLRVPASQALMKLQSAACRYIREFLYDNEFTEIHTPKLLPGASEGGTEVFKLMYFDRPACLAQSPQLYKQMAICGDMKRVFEIAPAFRAENSNTNRHLTEFTMVDVEMEFKNHYFEVMEFLGDLVVYVFDKLNEKCKNDINVVKSQYPFEPLLYKKTKISFLEACKLLNDEGVKQDPTRDFTSDTEKALGDIMKKKYGTEFYMVYQYPKSARPFYTMKDPKNPEYTNSYDFFVRGEEIISGSQRVHDSELLTANAKAAGINVESLKDYLESFKYGTSPHAGMGMGLERIVKLFCGIRNIRKCIMFTRDPKRLSP